MTPTTVSQTLGLLAITLASVASAQSPGFWETRPPLRFARQELAATVVNGLVYAGGGLAANTQGFLAIGTTPDLVGTTILGFRTHLDLSKPIVLLAASSTATGTSTFGLPIPSTATGTGFAQFLWANTAACGGAGTVSSTHGSEIRIR